MSYAAYGDSGPLVQALLEGQIEIPNPESPPADVYIDRIPGGGFVVSYGKRLSKQKIELTKKKIVLSKTLGSSAIAIALLKSIEVDNEGIVFGSADKRVHWPVPTQIISSWLRELILRNLVVYKGTR